MSPGLDFETQIIAKPNLAEVLAREMHAIDDDAKHQGKVYNSEWGQRMKGSGLWADLIKQRFEKTCARLGLNRQRVALDVSQFEPGRLRGQGSLF